MTDEKRSNAGQSTGPPTEHVPHPSAASQGKDRYLVLRAQDGDIEAFGKLVERYQGTPVSHRLYDRAQPP